MSQPAFLRLDLFPADITLPDNQILSQHRIIVTDTEALIYRSKEDIVFRAPITHFEGSVLSGYSLGTDTQGEITFKRSKGCGCGSPLKGFYPFSGVPYTSTKNRYISRAESTD